MYIVLDGACLPILWCWSKDNLMENAKTNKRRQRGGFYYQINICFLPLFSSDPHERAPQWKRHLEKKQCQSRWRDNRGINVSELIFLYNKQHPRKECCSRTNWQNTYVCCYHKDIFLSNQPLIAFFYGKSICLNLFFSGVGNGGKNYTYRTSKKK